MLYFSVPKPEGSQLHIHTPGHTVCFAGSRYFSANAETASCLVNMLGSLGCQFITGCAQGVDRSFRRVFLNSKYKEKCFVACAFSRRAEQMKGLSAAKVVPENLPTKIALSKRTVWMVSFSSLVILFPSNPIGKGSALCLRTALSQGKPVFMVTGKKPDKNESFWCIPSNLFGLIEGFWLVPRKEAGDE